MAFSGQFDHKIDIKGRMNLPAIYRDDFRDGAVLTFLPLYPAIFTPDDWADYKVKLQDSGVFSRAELQVMYGFAMPFVPDAQNRVVINSKIRNLGNLDELVTIVGSETHLAIYQRDAWAALEAATLAGAPGEKSLAEKYETLDFV